jgi:hypothetical protein
MYRKHGVEVPRKGKYEGLFIDLSKWERNIWSVLVANEEVKKEEIEDVQIKLKEPDLKALEEVLSHEQSPVAGSRPSPSVKAPPSDASTDIWYMSSPEYTKTSA